MTTQDKQDKQDKGEDIWNKFVNGDKSAFAAIYNLYTDALFSYGMKLNPDKDFVKDCIQDVFLDIYEHKSQLSIPKNINFYLFKALKRTLFRKLKKERKNDGLNDLNQTYFATEYNIESETIDKEIEKRNKRIINLITKELTSKQQEILYLKFNKGFSYIEISEIVGIDHNSVRKQVYRAIKKLRTNPVFKNNIDTILFLFYPNQ